jgi:hypothetical protein
MSNPSLSRRAVLAGAASLPAVAINPTPAPALEIGPISPADYIREMEALGFRLIGVLDSNERPVHWIEECDGAEQSEPLGFLDRKIALQRLRYRVPQPDNDFQLGVARLLAERGTVESFRVQPPKWLYRAA